MNAVVSNVRSHRSARIRGALLATALTAVATLMPAARAQAADVQVRVLVDVADLVFRSGRPYYHDHGYYQPVLVEYDRWRRPVYYRYEPRPVVVYRQAPPPRYYAPPPRHGYAPPHYYQVAYDDGRYDHDHHGRKGGKHGKGHGHDGHGGHDYRD